MTFDDITEPQEIKADEHQFGQCAFRRARAVCQHGDINSLQELRQFLQNEKDECARRARWEGSMKKYYDGNAGIAFDMEARAFSIMIDRAERLDRPA